MKEAAGEANMTVVTIVLIAAIVAIATPIITSTMKGIGKKSCCQAAGGIWKGNACTDYEGNSVDYDWDDKTNTCDESSVTPAG